MEINSYFHNLGIVFPGRNLTILRDAFDFLLTNDYLFSCCSIFFVSTYFSPHHAKYGRNKPYILCQWVITMPCYTCDNKQNEQLLAKMFMLAIACVHKILTNNLNHLHIVSLWSNCINVCYCWWVLLMELNVSFLFYSTFNWNSNPVLISTLTNEYSQYVFYE